MIKNKQVNREREVRLLRTGYKTAAMNMAIDESVLIRVSKGLSRPTLRFYGWKPSAVSIGYFQGMEDEVDIKRCKALGIDVIRRITGGGAVFHDKEVTYSLITKEDTLYISKNIIDSYKQICQGIIDGLKILGIYAKFVPLNDIVVHGKKLSGNAQTRKKHCILQHGTLLIGVNIDKMFSLLKVPSEKIRDKLISNVKQRVTSIEQELNKKVSFEEVCEALEEGFKKGLNLTMKPSKLTSSEITMAKKLAYEKYSKNKWNFMR